jgi:hypothetical protein
MAYRTHSGIQFGDEADWSGAPYLSIDIELQVRPGWTRYSRMILL